MKKFLSLVLALVMTMSLVTISAGAKDFTDDSAINYDEAIDVMSALEVVEGYPDGSFMPEKTLTRAEAAKIICNMILGPTTASALSADAAPFKDVPANHWAAGYIAYCAQQGIITGYGNGVFGVNDTLTGYQFMKMLLCALGYDASIEGYTGANWSIAVAKRALNIGLDDGNDDFVGTNAVTREEACLYGFNTLTADMVEYDSTTNISVGGAQVVIAGSKAKVVENFAAASKQYDGEYDAKMQFCEKYFSSLKLDKDADEDVFGRPANTWYKKNDKVGTYAKTADATYTKKVESSDIYKDLDLSDPYPYTVVTDGEPDGWFDVQKKGAGDYNAYDDKVGDGNGNLIEVFEDEKVIVVINSYLMKVDGDYDKDDEELVLETVANTDAPDLDTGKDKLSSDDYDGLDEYKDGDYVIVTVADGEVQSIAKAEKVTAAVTEYVADDTVTAGGKTYEYSAKADDGVTEYDYDLKEEYDLYLDPYGYVLFADGVEAEGSYVYISEFAKTSGLSANAKTVAYAYFLDGTEDEITLNKVDGNKPASTSGTGYTSKVTTTSGADYYTGWYRYSLKDSGKYDLKVVADTDSVATSLNDVITDYSAHGTEIAGAYRGNSSTKFIVLDKNGDVSVYTGIKKAPDTKAGSSAVVDVIHDGGSYAKYVFIDVDSNGEVKGGSTSSDLIFVLAYDKTGTDADGDEYYRYKAIVNGEKKKIKLETSASFTLGELNDSVDYNSKGYVTDMDAVTNGDDYVVRRSLVDADVKYKNNTVIIDTTSFYLADNAKIYVITDGDDVTTVSASKLAKDYDGTLDGYVCGVINADDEISTLYVRVD